MTAESLPEHLCRIAGDIVRADGDGISAVVGSSEDGSALGIFLGGDSEDAELAALAAGALVGYVSPCHYDWRTSIDSPVAEIGDDAIVADYAAPPRWGRRPSAADRNWAGLDPAEYPVTQLRIGPIDRLFAYYGGEAVDNRAASIARAILKQ